MAVLQHWNLTERIFVMRKLTYLLSLLFIVGVALTFTSCKEDEPAPPPPSDEVITSNITENTTWETGNTYILGSRVAVVDGVTLTIEPGVVVKGRSGQEANATALIIARGGMIMAQGTANAPIIFTAEADAIAPGQIESPNLPPTQSNQWGGLLILGKAPISVASNNETNQIEGIPPSDTNGLYGGTDPNDNSGVLRYVSIRHGGTNIGDGNEINGLTLGGVGAGTIIENVEVVGNQDDGIEWFGGTVNVRNALVWNAGDDGIDTDQAWAGTLDNFIVIAGEETDHALEIDGPEGDATGAHTVKNGWVKGAGDTELGNFRSGALGSFENIYYFNFPELKWDIISSGEEDEHRYRYHNKYYSNPHSLLYTFSLASLSHLYGTVFGQPSKDMNYSVMYFSIFSIS